MLLTVDIGNTHTVLGIYQGDELTLRWRLKTDSSHTFDEYHSAMLGSFQSHSIVLRKISGVCVSCVVPSLLNNFIRLSKQLFSLVPLIAGPGFDMGITICYDDPKQVGADRIVEAAAAYAKYGRSLIVVDFGTATTFDYVSERGEFMGGAIAPGIASAGNALINNAYQLPRVDFIAPSRVVASNTVEGMQAGIVYGYAGLVDGLIRRIKEEVQSTPLVVATGGLASLVCAHSKSIDEVDEVLMMKGLKLIYDLNTIHKVPKV